MGLIGYHTAASMLKERLRKPPRVGIPRVVLFTEERRRQEYSYQVDIDFYMLRAFPTECETFARVKTEYDASAFSNDEDLISRLLFVTEEKLDIGKLQEKLDNLKIIAVWENENEKPVYGCYVNEYFSDIKLAGKVINRRSYRDY